MCTFSNTARRNTGLGTGRIQYSLQLLDNVEVFGKMYIVAHIESWHVLFIVKVLFLTRMYMRDRKDAYFVDFIE